MHTVSIAEIAHGLNIPGAYAGVCVGFSLDSRTIKPGEIFIALSGPNFDGHAFVDVAFSRGAVAAIVQKPMTSHGPCLQVQAVRLALNQIAQLMRLRYTGKMLAITGSCGKTTTRHMVASLLKARTHSVFETEGNYNNHFGVPLMLTRLLAPYQQAVLECGASAPGEILPLVELIQPDVAAVTNVHPAHMAGFGSLDMIAKTKGQIFEPLTSQGLAVMPVNSPYTALWQQQAGLATPMTFGLDAKADVYAHQIDYAAQETRAYLHTPLGQGEILLPMPGQSMLLNALTATAMVLPAYDCFDALAQAIACLQPFEGRFNFKPGLRAGLTVLDDCYNANPAAFAAAVEVLMLQQGVPVVVMGDMVELGVAAEEAHLKLGQLLKQKGVQQLWAFGPLSRLAVAKFGEGAHWFEQVSDLMLGLQQGLPHGPTVVLVKGARVSCLERVVDFLVNVEGNRHV